MKHESRRKRYSTSKDSKKIEPLRRRLGAAPGAVGRLIIIFMPGDRTRAAYATHAVSAECGMMQHGLATSLHEHLPGESKRQSACRVWLWVWRVWRVRCAAVVTNTVYWYIFTFATPSPNRRALR